MGFWGTGAMEQWQGTIAGDSQFSLSCRVSWLDEALAESGPAAALIHDPSQPVDSVIVGANAPCRVGVSRRYRCRQHQREAPGTARNPCPERHGQGRSRPTMLWWQALALTHESALGPAVASFLRACRIRSPFGILHADGGHWRKAQVVRCHARRRRRQIRSLHCNFSEMCRPFPGLW